MFACTNVENTLYLDIFMEDECWTGNHQSYILSVAIPAAIVWGLGLPLASFIILFRLNKSHKLDDPGKKKSYGFLYSGYKRSKYWWELVILARKVIVLFTLLWLSGSGVVI